VKRTVIKSETNSNHQASNDRNDRRRNVLDDRRGELRCVPQRGSTPKPRVSGVAEPRSVTLGYGVGLTPET
jgi:hypothetical protein